MQATDMINIGLVFTAIKETILQNALKDCDILVGCSCCQQCWFISPHCPLKVHTLANISLSTLIMWAVLYLTLLVGLASCSHHIHHSILYHHFLFLLALLTPLHCGLPSTHLRSTSLSSSTTHHLSHLTCGLCMWH